MGRVIRPLADLHARVEGGDTLPLVVAGGPLEASQLRTGVASAQVKSGLILAALQAEGESTVREPVPTRDHTERMLRAMGAPLEPFEEGSGWRIRGGSAALSPLTITIPGDPSSAAYVLALACLLPESEIAVDGVSLNPTRLGFYRLLRHMGAEVHCEEVSPASVRDEPEPRGRIVARSSSMRPIGLAEHDVIDAIDEVPLLAVMATQAPGVSVIRGAGELRRKESDRVSATASLLRAFGADVEELPDGLRITGGAPLHGARVDASGDHRIAMCAAVLAALSDGPTQLAGASWVRISYPGFFDDLASLSEPR
jgi:3-phosphoshikimate 1-carboxyvinyltransferase